MWNLLIMVFGFMFWTFANMEGTNNFEDRIDKDWEPKYVTETVYPENYFIIESEEKMVCVDNACQNILSKTIKSQVVK